MFDDYNYKNTSKRISMRFVQECDEPMYPWEIAGFLNKLNTVYYKFELLNSICSAISQGISPKEIFVFNNSLPLYERYAEMNVLGESQAATIFYPIGVPYPLVPSANIYKINFLYQAFYEINSFLLKNHVRPLPTNNIAFAYDVLKKTGLEDAEKFIVELATKRAEKSFENARKLKKTRELVTKDDIIGCLEKYALQRTKLLRDLDDIEALSDIDLSKIIKSKKSKDKRLASILLAFFRYFDKTSRPLVCARVSEGNFRILGRSLVNKKERTGLEVKEVVRNSPLGALIEGGVALYQATQQEKRANELHKLELEQKKLDLQLTEEKLVGERLTNFHKRIAIAKELDQITQGSDIQAISNLENSFTKELLLNTYNAESKNAVALLYDRGLVLDERSIKIVDIKV